MPSRWNCLPLFSLLLLLAFATPAQAQPAEGVMLTNEIRMARARLQGQQPNLSPRQLDQLAYEIGRSNYLAHAIDTAFMGNNLPRVEQLLKEYPGTVDDVAPFPGMGSLLYRAAESGPDERLSFLLQHKADPNRPGRQGEMPLLAALRFQRWSIALRLLEAGAQGSATNAEGQNALELLLQSWWGMQPGTDPRGELLQALLERGANPFAPARYRSDSSVVEFVLQRSNSQGNLPADLLLTNRPSPLRRTPSGQTALHLAVLWGRTNALQFLLTAGFSPDLTNAHGLTALQLLADAIQPQPPGGRAGSIRGPMVVSMPGWGLARPGLTPAPSTRDVAEFLLRHGATLDLFSAAGLGRTNELAAMLSATPSLANARDGCGRAPLHYAVSALQFETARLLLRSGANLDVTTTRPVPQRGMETPLPAGLTPLHLAALRNSPELAQMLLRAGAAASPTNQAGDTPLHLAARDAQTNLVSVLLAAHAALNLTNQAGQTPLQLAAASGSGQNLELLLKAGANPTAGLRSNTLVHIAAASGNAAALLVLLRRGLPVDAPDAEGRTPLEHALAARSWEALKLLKSKGANLNAQDHHGNAPLHLAATLQDDFVWHATDQSLWEKWKQDWLSGGGLRQRTLSRFIQWKLVSMPTPPLWTNSSLSAWLLQNGAQPNLTNEAGQTPLRVLCGQSWLSYTQPATTNRIASLLQAGARVDARDAAGLSCLHVAATNALPSLLTLLASQVQPPATLRDAQGRTPLHYAAQSRYYGNEAPAARLCALLAAGFPADTPDTQGRTALHEAVATYGNPGWHHEDLLLTLLTNHANPNAQDAQGRTPLHTAMQSFGEDPNYGLREVCLLLLSNRAQFNLPDRQGRTPLHLLTGLTGPATHPGSRIDDLVLNYQWDFAAHDRNGQTPVHLWCSNLDTACSACAGLLRTVLTNQALVDLTNGAGDTPLHVAIRAGRNYTVPLLLHAGADPARRNAHGETAYRLAVEKWDPYWQIADGLRPAGVTCTFFNAIFQRDRHSFDVWIEADPSLCSVTNALNQTPLQAATERGLTSYAHRLLELGAPLDLLSALRLDYTNDFHKLLAQHQGPLPASWLFEAVQYHRTEAAQALVAAGGAVRAADAEGHSLAYRAQVARLPGLEEWFHAQGCCETLFDALALQDRELLEHFFAADRSTVNTTNGQGRTPLLATLAAGKAELVGFLLDQGASIHSRTPEGWTALHLAVANNRLAAGKLLLQAGADPNQLAAGGMGPLHLAAALGHNKFAELLLTNGADVNLCPPAQGGSFRNSPLHWAAHRGGLTLVKLLLAHGADPKATNDSGLTPAALAESTSRGMLLWFVTPAGLPRLIPQRLPQSERAEILEMLKQAEAHAVPSPPEPKP